MSGIATALGVLALGAIPLGSILWLGWQLLIEARNRRRRDVLGASGEERFRMANEEREARERLPARVRVLLATTGASVAATAWMLASGEYWAALATGLLAWGQLGVLALTADRGDPEAPKAPGPNANGDVYVGMDLAGKDHVGHAVVYHHAAPCKGFKTGDHDYVWSKPYEWFYCGCKLAAPSTPEWKTKKEQNLHVDKQKTALDLAGSWTYGSSFKDPVTSSHTIIGNHTFTKNVAKQETPGFLKAWLDANAAKGPSVESGEDTVSNTKAALSAFGTALKGFSGIHGASGPVGVSGFSGTSGYVPQGYSGQSSGNPNYNYQPAPKVMGSGKPATFLCKHESPEGETWYVPGAKVDGVVLHYCKTCGKHAPEGWEPVPEAEPMDPDTADSRWEEI